MELSIASALAVIVGDAVRRSRTMATSVANYSYAVLAMLPTVHGQDGNGGYTELNTSDPSYNNFRATAPDNTTSDGRTALADINSFVKSKIGGVDWASWEERATQIRLGNTHADCVGNLSLALSGLGGAYQAGAAGATTLLTLLPTAGALIGAPAKELWVLYKLMPLAGVLSMLLSLGGNIVPMEVNQYERIDSFSYAGMVGSLPEEKPTAPTDPSEQEGVTEAEKFAKEVMKRAMNHSGSNKSMKITLGILLQLFWLSCIMAACWFVQTGAIIVWWCTVRPLPNSSSL